MDLLWHFLLQISNTWNSAWINRRVAAHCYTFFKVRSNYPSHSSSILKSWSTCKRMRRVLGFWICAPVFQAALTAMDTLNFHDISSSLGPSYDPSCFKFLSRRCREFSVVLLIVGSIQIYLFKFQASAPQEKSIFVPTRTGSVICR